jgi:hypothetical protein
MASQLDAKFFRLSKKVNRAIEITDNQAFIPAVKDKPEIRVPLPNRRLKTVEERRAELDARLTEVLALDEQIETERKALLELVKSSKISGSGGSEVVAQNLKVKGLVERRSAIVRPEKWIEDLQGLSFKDVFASNRDIRKIGVNVYQIKRRVEPISSLYVDLAAIAQAAEPVIEAPALEEKPKTVAAPKTTEEVAKGVIIGQRKTFKIKKGP